MNRLKLVLVVSLALLIVPLAFALHSVDVNINPDITWETKNTNFTLEVDRTGADPVYTVELDIVNGTVTWVNDKFHWDEYYTDTYIKWSTELIPIGDDSVSFVFSVEPDLVDSNVTYDWTVSTTDNNNYTDVNDVQVLIKNDDIAPDVVDISPANFNYVKNETINFIIYVLENETGIKSDANLGYRDDVGVTLTGNVTASISLDCDSETNQCTGSLNPNIGMNLPNNPFLDFRVTDLEDKAGNIYDVWPNLIHHYYVDYQAPIIELQSPPDQIQIPNDSYDFVFNMTDDSFKTDIDSNWLGDSPAINCTLLINGNNYGSNSSTQDHENTVITADLSGLGDGNHLWQIKCIDDSGWIELSPERFFIRNSEAPNVDLEDPINGQYVSDSFIFWWKATDSFDQNLTCNLTVDDEVIESDVISESGVSTGVPVSGLLEGYHNWSVTCWDSVPNYNTSDIWDFIVDITPPDVNIFNPDNNSIEIGPIDFEFNPDDNLDPEMNCELYINDNLEDSQDVPDGTNATFTYDFPSEGEWIDWYIICYDETGFTKTDTRLIYVDTYLADPTFNPPDFETDQTSVSVNFTVTFNEDVFIDSATFNGSAVNLTTSDSREFTYTATVASGVTYIFDITATDLYGHSNTKEHTYTITYNAPPTPPVAPQSGGGGSGRVYKIQEELPTSNGDCAYNWDCTVWEECVDGQQTRTCTNDGNCEGDMGEPIEVLSCTVGIIPEKEETTSDTGVGFAAGLFNRLKENWWIIPIVGALLAVLSYFGFGKYGTKIKINQKLKDKRPIDV